MGPGTHSPGILDAEAERGRRKNTAIESKPHEETGIKCSADREHENRPSRIQRVWEGIATRFSSYF